MDKLASTRLGREVLKKMTGGGKSPLVDSFKQIARSGPKKLEKETVGWSKELHRQASSQPGYVKKPLQKTASNKYLAKIS
jgi:hypothetical protein